jgi:hypothetical protein
MLMRLGFRSDNLHVWGKGNHVRARSDGDKRFRIGVKEPDVTREIRQS